jgi:exopolysaccharide biosynthesis polyprenyl glycosylphosphotransferase
MTEIRNDLGARKPRHEALELDPRLDTRRGRLRLVDSNHAGSNHAGSSYAGSSSQSSPATAPTSAPQPAWASRYRVRLIITDYSVIVVSVLGAFASRFWNQSPATFAKVATDYWAIGLVIMLTWIVTLGAYRTRSPRVVGVGVTEYRSVVNSSLMAFGLLGILFLILEINIARGFFLLALPIGLAGLILSRWMWRNWLLRQRRSGKFVSRAVVVGDPEDVHYVISQMDKKAVSVYDIVGAAVDAETIESIRVNSRNIDVVSDLENVAAVAARLHVDAVIVAGEPNRGGHFIRDLGWDLEGSGAELVVASRLTNIAGPRIHLRPVEGLPLMHVELPHYEGGKHMMKRALDIGASGLALLALMPVMLLIALVIRRGSPGPVLFRQERVGKSGKTFHMIKFRSMVETAEDDLAGLLDQNEGAGVLFKMRNDPRITKTGQFLRKYSLDELPQLWNIFIGDMSLVGPRPPLQSEVASYGDRVHRRLYIKPGLTGMWQVNGRSNLDWDESVRLDLYYVENWSITGDLVIMWRTLKVLVAPIGAY